MWMRRLRVKSTVQILSGQISVVRPGYRCHHDYVATQVLPPSDDDQDEVEHRISSYPTQQPSIRPGQDSRERHILQSKESRRAS